MQYAAKIVNILKWILVLAIALASYRFLFLGLEISFPDMLAHIADRNLAFLLHISASPVALALGLFQFLPRLRASRPRVHRWAGRIYTATVLIGGLAGLALALGSLDRPVAAAGFGLLAILWLGTTVRAVYLARARRIVEHRRWMIRSYALTLAAVTLRLIMPFFIFIGEMEYAEISSYVGWLSWVPNLMFAEWYLSRRRSLPNAAASA